MGWLRRLAERSDDGGRAPDGPTVRGRARVVPASTRQRSTQPDDGTDWGGFSPNERIWVELTLTPLAADDGLPVPAELQDAYIGVPIWVATVLRQAGTNEPLAGSLPPEIELPVAYDARTRTLASVDVDAAVRELQPLRDVSVEHFKQTGSYLAPLRGAASLPGDVVDAGRDLAATWKDAVAGLARDATNDHPAPSWSAEEVEAMRRNAVILAARYQKKPKERERARAAALESLPLNAANVVAGALAPEDFAALVMVQEISTAITADEANALRDAAGLT